jgi:hypothetical protein
LHRIQVPGKFYIILFTFVHALFLYFWLRKTFENLPTYLRSQFQLFFCTKVFMPCICNYFASDINMSSSLKSLYCTNTNCYFRKNTKVTKQLMVAHMCSLCTLKNNGDKNMLSSSYCVFSSSLFCR